MNDDVSWVCIEISGKIAEAKNLIYPKSFNIIKNGFDLKTTVKLDSEQSPSHTTAFTRIPNSELSWSWQEEFKFEAIPRFKFLNFTIWVDKVDIRSQNNREENILTPIGKVAIPESYLSSSQIHDQWMVLRDASLEARISGQVQLSVEYYPQTGSISVSLLKGKDIDLNKPLPGPNTFVSFHILPDPKALSTEISHVKKGSHNPSFSEAFSFKFNPKTYEKEELHCAVWGEEGKSIVFLGHFYVPIKDVVELPMKESWFVLGALPNDSIWVNHVNAKGISKNESTEEFIKRFIQKIQETQPTFPEMQKTHSFSERPMVRGNCFICDGKLMGSHLSCGDCFLNCHQKCQKTAATTCGEVGQLKLSVTVTRTEVLHIQNYLEFIELLKKNNFEILLIIARKAGHLKENFTDSLLPVLRYDYVPFLNLALRNEIKGLENPQTLFRGNSFCTKVLYSFISEICTYYLNKTLLNNLLQIVNSKKSFEIDESKFNDTYKKHWGASQCNVINNMENLRNFLEILLSSIFDSAASLPSELKKMFNTIRESALEMFPNEKNISYTSVSGIFFLRIINPALLNPEKYGIQIDKLNQFQSRKLLLISKVLQNLANFVPFQNKEACMLPLNSFLRAKTELMKDFIDSISAPEPFKLSSKMNEYIQSIEEYPDLIALSCAKIHDTLQKQSNELLDLNFYPKLKHSMNLIENMKVKSTPSSFRRFSETSMSNQSFHEPKSPPLFLKILKERVKSLLNSPDSSDLKLNGESQSSQLFKKYQNGASTPNSPIYMPERREDFLKDLKSTQESHLEMILNLTKEFMDFKTKSKEYQERQEQKLFDITAKLDKFHQQNISSLKSLDTSKMNLDDFDNFRKDLEKELYEATKKLHMNQNEDISENNENRTLSEPILSLINSYKKEESARIANMEADLLLFKNQLDDVHSALKENVNLLAFHAQSIKKLESGKVTYEDLEGVRKDLKFSLAELLEKKVKNPEEPQQEKDLKKLTDFLYQDSFSSLSIPIVPALTADIKPNPPTNQELMPKKKNEHQISRYLLKPSPRLTDINNRLESLAAEFSRK